MTELAEERWVRIMADHSADPLWHRDGCMAELAELPVSPPLIRRLGTWAQWYEQNRSWEGDHSFDYAPFSAEGLAIARAVKAELPAWRVTYWDEAAYVRDPAGPRETFEYEIGAA
jgi:hypothetical protein